MKKLLLIICTLPLIASCDLLIISPSDVVTKYLDSLMQEKFREAYELHSEKDKSAKNYEEFEASKKDDNDTPLRQTLKDSFSYKIVSAEEREDTAVVRVETTLPDPRSLIGDAMAAALSGGDAQKELSEKLKNKELPTTTTQQEYKLVKEASAWKIFMNWGDKEKIADLVKEAEQLKKEKNYHGAAEKYSQILELDSELVEAKTALKETEKEIENFDAKQEYIENVRLYDLKADYYSTYLEENIPGVEFKIENKGDKTLGEIEVTVYFKNAEDKIIAEEIYYPVITSGFPSQRTKPLKSNYIWQQERGRFYTAKSVPDEWAKGKVSAKITNIEFVE